MSSNSKNSQAPSDASKRSTSQPVRSRPRRRDHRASGPSRRIRYAVVGLGHIAQSAVLPAFAHLRRECELAALISDDPEKREQLAHRYKVPRTYAYDRFDECLASGIDAVYIALPNNLHHPYAIKAANAGIHVLCEKPMGLTVDECTGMITAAKTAGIKLMIGYRLHFERTNLKAISLANADALGDLRFFTSTFSMQVKPGDVRTRAAMGGGSVYDLGIYCINAARYLFRDEPIEVFAMSASSADERFTEIDEMTSVVMRFPRDRLASFTSSFGASAAASYELVGSKGSLCIDPAYEYEERMSMWLTSNGRTRKTIFPVRDQFAAELSYFARCIVDDVRPEPSGEEGLADLRVIEAIHRSAQEGRPIQITGAELPLQRPQPDQVVDRPAQTREPLLVHTRPSSEE